MTFSKKIGLALSLTLFSISIPLEAKTRNARSGRDAKFVTSSICSLGVFAGIQGIDQITGLNEWESVKTILKSIVAAIGLGCSFYLNDTQTDATRIIKKSLILGVSAAFANNRYIVEFFEKNSIFKIFVDKGIRTLTTINDQEVTCKNVDIPGFGTAARNLLPYIILSTYFIDDADYTIEHLNEAIDIVEAGQDIEIARALHVQPSELKQALMLTRTYYQKVEEMEETKQKPLFSFNPKSKLPGIK